MKQKYFSIACVCFLPFLHIEYGVCANAQTNASPKSQDAKKSDTPAPAKKTKPHFVGMRRPSEKQDDSAKAKNPWVKTKTHPKAEKKESPKSKEENLPSDMPYLNQTRTLPFKRASLSTSLLLPEDENASSLTSQNGLNQQEPLYPVLGDQAPRGHVYFTGDWLFWRTRQEGMEFAVQGTSASALTPFPQASSVKLSFDLTSGFRVGLGVHLPNDGWDIYVNYTDFRPKASKNADGSLFSSLLYNPPLLAISAEAEWKIDFKTLDIEIGRAYFIGRTLSFRPFIGMMGAWIDQHTDIHYIISSGQMDHIDTHNDFKGAGPRFGIGSNWHLGKGFSFFGNLAAALTIGHFDLEQHQEQGELDTIHLKSDLNLISPVLQLIAGLAWDKNYHRDQWHFGISAGFESQYWWCQNQMERFTDSATPLFIRAGGDLAMYGLTLKGRLDF